MKRVDTVDLKGKQYAQVSDRIKAFREDCPRGSITVLPPEVRDGGTIIVGVRVLKDKADVGSGEATQYAMGEVGKEKIFEKLQTVATGRALAMLGYMASGEIASSEEMEEFNQYKEDKLKEQRATTIFEIENTKTIDELKEVFINSGLMFDEEVIKAKDEMKAYLSHEDKT
jgi:hypothetical protein